MQTQGGTQTAESRQTPVYPFIHACTDTPMSSRKRAQVFRRSFVGCWTCRRRKVKCDAKRPQCDRCTRAKVRCEGYDIKLNWSMPLTNMQGSYCSLSGKPVNGGEEKAGEIEMQPDSTTIQRSNIELVRWWLYDYYHEMDNALSVLEKTQNDRSGPFGVIRDRQRLTGKITVQKVEESSSPPASALSPGNAPENTDAYTRAPISKTSSVQSVTRNTMAPSSSGKQAPVLAPAPIPPPPTPSLTLLQPFKDITAHALDYNETIEVTRTIIVDHGHLIQLFIDSIPGLFDPTIKGRLSAKIREITGNYVILNKPLDFCLVLSIITLISLKSAKSSDHAIISKCIAYRQKTTTILSQQNRQSFHEYEPLALLLVLMIMVNSTLGVYDHRLFQFSLDDLYQSSNSLMTDYYHFFQSTNILFNHDQFQFDSKFLQIYADMLDPEYNLLKEVERPQKSKDMKIDSTELIRISSKETPAHKIMRVPKYIDEDLDDDNEPPPPSFTIHFKGMEKKNNKHNTEEDLDNDDDDNEDGEDEDDDQEHQGVLHDEINDNTEEEEALKDSLSLINVFSLPSTTKDSTSVYSISKNLIILYHHLCQLINHRRHFISVNMKSRNFAKVCADFEDVLMRQAASFCHSQLDEQWYHLLIILYFKLVQNYPKSMLTFHLKKIANAPHKTGLFKLLSSMGGKLWSESDDVWCNNWALKEWLWKNRSDAFKDWHYDEEAPKGIFLF